MNSKPYEGSTLRTYSILNPKQNPNPHRLTTRFSWLIFSITTRCLKCRKNLKILVPLTEEQYHNKLGNDPKSFSYEAQKYEKSKPNNSKKNSMKCLQTTQGQDSMSIDSPKQRIRFTCEISKESHEKRWKKVVTHWRHPQRQAGSRIQRE